MTTKYTRGAVFERQVLRYLIGDNTHATNGYIHTLLPLFKHPTKDTLPLVYGIRSAGSRGFYDLLLIVSYDDGSGFTLGIQCKTGNHSEKRILSDLRNIKKHTNVHGVYALKEKGSKKPFFFPDLDELLFNMISPKESVV